MPSFFDLMKYARTGIASPDMTGFDKLRAKAAFGGYPVRTITGVPPLTFKADGTPLTAWSIAGNGQKTGTPTPDAPIMPEFVDVRTANLAPPLTEWNDGYIAYNGSVQPQSSGNQQEKYSSMIPVSASATYKFSCDGGFPEGESYAWKTATLYDSSGTFIRRLDAGTSVDPFTLNTTATTAFVRLMCRTYGESLKLMLNAGNESLPYIPYGFQIPITNAGQTVPVYLGQTQTVRKIRKLVLTGEETYYDYTFSHEKSVYVSNVLDTNYTRAQGYCTHYPVYPETGNLSGTNYTTWIGASSKQIFFIAACDVLSLENADAFKAWVAAQYATGTPVTVWYVLATPETAIVNEPLCKIGDYADELHSTDAGVTIPTAKGQNTLTVDTELQPSAVSVTGHIKSS